MKAITNREAAEIIAEAITSQSRPNSQLQILEAGCGQRWCIDLGEIPYVLTGLDIDKYALDIRKNVHKDLHQVIEGDLRNANLPKKFYDVIFCSYVLEHIAEAEDVIGNFQKWLKPDGLAIILVPNPFSVGGFITNHTPFSFHVWIHRYIFGNPDAGKPGHTPYPTFYTEVLTEPGMAQFCKRVGFELVGFYKIRRWYKGALRSSVINSFTRLIGFLSLGFLEGDSTNVLYILRKRSVEESNENLKASAAEMSS